MVDVVLTRQKVRDGARQQLHEWCQELSERKEEVRETLRRERMYTESAFLHRTDDGDYLYYMEAEDVEDALETFAKSDTRTDQEHAAVMKDVVAESPCLEEFELLYHAVDPDRGGEC